MAKVLVDDALWVLIEPHLLRRKARRTGRPRVPDRAALTGIIFVLQTEMPREYLPPEMGCGSVRTSKRVLESSTKRHEGTTWRGTAAHPGSTGSESLPRPQRG